jgi:hypothetical protein
MKELKLLAIIVVAVMVLMGSCALIQMTCAAPAMGAANNTWICMASADRQCDFTSEGRTRKVAETKALKKCKSKCSKECRIEACIRKR